LLGTTAESEGHVEDTSYVDDWYEAVKLAEAKVPNLALRRALTNACARVEDDAPASAVAAKSTGSDFHAHFRAKAVEARDAGRAIRDLLGVRHDVGLFPGYATQYHLAKLLEKLGT
jgi:hypothetical protein